MRAEIVPGSIQHQSNQMRIIDPLCTVHGSEIKYSLIQNSAPVALPETDPGVPTQVSNILVLVVFARVRYPTQRGGLPVTGATISNINHISFLYISY